MLEYIEEDNVFISNPPHQKSIRSRYPLLTSALHPLNIVCGLIHNEFQVK